MQSNSIFTEAIEKKSFKDAKSIEHIKNEKEALQHFTNIEAKGINKLINTFQDEDKLYMVL